MKAVTSNFKLIYIFTNSHLKLLPQNSNGYVVHVQYTIVLPPMESLNLFS